MESMRRSEVNISHHPNKVATNNGANTESNKHNKLVGSASTTSIPSSSNFNNRLSVNTHKNKPQNPTKQIVNKKVASSRNFGPPKTNSSQTIGGVKVSVKGVGYLKATEKTLNAKSSTSEDAGASGCNLTSTTSEAKDTNFEYEDEWDIGGIPELLDDLDADIEKSSTSDQNALKGCNSSDDHGELESSATKVKALNKIIKKSGYSESLLKKKASATAAADKFNSTTLSRSLTQSFSPLQLNLNEKVPIATKCTHVSIPPSPYIPSNKSGSGFIGKVTNSSSALLNIGGKYQKLGGPASYQTTPKVLGEQSDGDCGNRVISTVTKPYSLASSSSSSHTSNSECGVQKNNTLAISTFAGFSKGGNLVSSFTNSISHENALTNTNLSTALGNDLISNLSNHCASGGMSSQSSGIGSNNSSAGGGAGGGPVGSQNIGGSGGSKSSTKMSIDHQATLDKGLKMKIKRTKPGTKTSEAKHEIVKATEQQQQQQQNGSIGVNNPNNLDDNNGLNTNTHSPSSSGGANSSGSSNQNTGGGNVSSSNTSNVSGSNKKQHVSNISNSNSQGNTHNSAHSNCSSSGPTGTGSSSGQVTPQSNKRGSSGHRREKAKEKAIHSNRLIADKNVTTATEKDNLTSSVSDKGGSSCHCSIDSTNVNSTSSCNNHSCARRSENVNSSSITVMSQRMSNSTGNNNVQTGSVPPGVFTPSVGSPAGVSGTTSAAAPLLTATQTASTSAAKSIGSNSAPNAPGPPGKDSTNCGNIKISSHIAAQLAAVAASSSFSNSQSNSSASSISGSSEIKTNAAIVPVGPTKLMAPGMISATVHHTISVPATSSSMTATASANKAVTSNNNMVSEDGIKSPPTKRAKHGDTSNTAKELVDICIGTSVGTITEPDCLGPCEPGTSVTLEGIVWHETEGGVLVVNVTWRGKTYVGTLLDCTRHDWAPPRFCDSPTEELDSRTPKGRGKRGRSAALTPDLSNFTETRSSVHSKLRNGTTKGGRAAARTAISATSTASTTTTTITSSSSSGNGGGDTPSTSPTAFLPPRSEKRKSKDESPSPINGDSECTTSLANASGIPISASGGGLTTHPQSLVNPVTGLNVQISTKKCKTASPCAISPVLLECPEQDCSKKYKHANGLRYHQSHAHGSACSMDEDSLQLPDEPPTPSCSPAPPAQNTRAVTPTPVEGPTLSIGELTVASATTSPNNTSAIPTSTSETSSQSADNIQTPSQAINQNATHDAAVVSETITATSTVVSGTSTFSSSTQNSPTMVTTVVTSTISGTVGGILSVSLPTVMTQSQQQHPLAGGSITAGISNQVLSQQQNLGIPNALNLPILIPEQSQTSSGGAKPGVLRFGPQNDTPNSGAPPSILSLQQQASQSSSQVNALAEQSPQRSAAQLSTHPENLQLSHQPSISTYTSSTAPTGQNVPGVSLSTKNSAGFSVVKQKKGRRSPGLGEYDGVVTRDNVQSPAYSDISDDSTPVGEQDILDKSQPKLIDIPNKKTSDLGAASIASGAQNIAPLGGYGMYQFYQHQQYLVPPPSSDQQSSNNKGLLPSALVQPPVALPSPQSQQGAMQSSHLMQQQQSHQQQQSILADYNKNKDPPLDLITKSSQQQQSGGHQQHLQSQDAHNQKDNPTGPPTPSSVNLSNVGPPNSGLPPGMGAMPSLGSSGVGPGGLPTPTPGKPLSHFYPFNYMSPGYPYNVDPNYGPVSIVSSDDGVKIGSHGSLSSSQPQNTAPPHPNTTIIKDERIKDSPSPHECSKSIPQQQQQLISSKLIKSEPMTKQEIKQEHNSGSQSQQQQPPQQQQQSVAPQQPHALHPKDLQGLGTYPNIYQRHPMTLATQQHLSREEELRRYYILSDEQRRQSAVAALRAVQAQNPQNSGPPGSLQAHVLAQHKEDPTPPSQHQQQMSLAQQQQQQQHHQQQQQHQQSQKSKSQSCPPNTNVNTNSGKATNLTKDISKQKQEEEIKIKQEGQKPTMETQGPPPPPTSQYFLHPSYIAPAPFSFDPNHPMYRNVLMSAAGPYNTAPYHLQMPRYHAPEDLSRNTGTKALDALHHAASQYYTTHKIHELSERALKSPTSGNSGGQSVAVKVSVSSPNVGIQQQAVNAGGITGPGSGPNTGPNTPNSGNHLTTTSQSSGGNGIPLNLQPPATGMSGPAIKTDVLNQKVLSGPGGPGSSLTGAPLNIDSHKQQGATSGPSGGGTIGPVTPGGNSSTTDSRSPPPQRHVHTHHHTHVGLGYPMYTAPYGAAVLASQQAAAVAVINPFPPGPTK
ncbi:zinc finger protein 608 isoform X2 [Eurosta solidaginis]|uniref:zinc finger protein 608 isoform X2 n=1 Tax=Eurosta solidaginis TaxID=178769 RepID=UPI003530E333